VVDRLGLGDGEGHGADPGGAADVGTAAGEHPEQRDRVAALVLDVGADRVGVAAEPGRRLVVGVVAGVGVGDADVGAAVAALDGAAVARVPGDADRRRPPVTGRGPGG